MQNKFKIEWVKFSHIEFIGNVIYRQYNKRVGISETEFFQNMWELIGVTESKLLYNVIGLCDYGGLIKMQFQSDSVIFDCGKLVKQYLAKAIDLLVETHENSQQKGLYNLTDTFKAMFSFIAAQSAVPKFEKAQRSFIDYMDISRKLDSERENTKQIFTLILKKEGTLTIAAKQVTKRLHHAIKKAVLKQVRIPCKDILLRMVTQKIHVHGLVLHDVIAMLEDSISEESVNYLQEYFQDPFSVFRKKILHVFDGCPDIILKDLIREKFDTATRKTRYFIETDLMSCKQNSLVQVICQNNYLRSLDVGEVDFDRICMPEYNKERTLNLVESCCELSQAEKEKIEEEVKKRMEDETEIIEKLKKLISQTDEINTDITLHQQLEMKDKVISDVNHHLFECVNTCPFCRGPCNEAHPGGAGPDSKHKSRCHRPQGFAGYVNVETNEFYKYFCNDRVCSNAPFRNHDTNFQWVKYRDYRTVNDYYNSWNIEGLTSDDSLYWKYITYQATKNLHRFFPAAKKPDISGWGGISKSEAIKNINSLFHLDGNTIARNQDGFHYIKPSQTHS